MGNTTLIDRIGHGTTDTNDAAMVDWLLRRYTGYEATLRRIAIEGQGEAAMWAVRALAGRSDPAEEAAA